MTSNATHVYFRCGSAYASGIFGPKILRELIDCLLHARIGSLVELIEARR
jgi:hypothetical protein